MPMTDKKIPLRGISGANLKYFAIITMLIDHCGLVIVYYGLLCGANPWVIAHQDSFWILYRIMRSIGRMAFPVFLFLLVQGFIHTHNRRAYALRLLIFALISELPFDLCVGQTAVSFQYQNVMWTLLFGFLMMWAMDRISRTDLPEMARYMLDLGCVAAVAGLTWLCQTDYSYKGILALAVLYFTRFNRKLTLLATVICFLWEPAAIFAAIPIALYNGKKGNSPKYFFYWFYPVHLLILYLIQILLLAT